MTVTWQQEVLWLTLLYRMLECGDSVPLDVDGTSYAFVSEELADLQGRGLIEAGDSGFWHVTKRALALRGQLVAMYDQTSKFEIFRSVNLTVELDEDNSDDDENVFDAVFDPRFAAPADDAEAERLGAEDLRLAMITYASKAVAESHEGRERGLPEVSPHRVVFLQRLGDGVLRDENVCFDLKLGALLREIEETVEAAYRCSDVSDDPGDDEAILQSVYTAGMIEQRKREGRSCRVCGVPLASFARAANEEGRELTTCPMAGCGAELSRESTTGGTVACARCGEETSRHRAGCMSCGARLRWTSPRVKGGLDDEHDVWGHSHGYVPYGWYDVDDPARDGAAFSVLIEDLF